METTEIEMALDALLRASIADDGAQAPRPPEVKWLTAARMQEVARMSRRDMQVADLKQRPVRAACRQAIRLLGEHLYANAGGIEGMSDVLERVSEADLAHFWRVRRPCSLVVPTGLPGATSFLLETRSWLQSKHHRPRMGWHRFRERQMVVLKAQKSKSRDFNFFQRRLHAYSTLRACKFRSMAAQVTCPGGAMARARVTWGSTEQIGRACHVRNLVNLPRFVVQACVPPHGRSGLKFSVFD